MTVLLDRCGSFLPEGTCSGQVHITGEVGALIEGECQQCGQVFALPVSEANPAIRRTRRLEAAGLPAAFATKRFDEHEHAKPALEAIRSWLACRADGLIPAPAFYGQTGTGKTHLLVAVCRRLIDHDMTVQFVSVRGLLRELQQFDNEPERRRVLARAVSVDVLALDDLGAQRQTDWRHDELADLIDRRSENARPVILATNYAPAMWPDMLDARTASRLRGMTFPVELTGPDRRTATTPQPVQ